MKSNLVYAHVNGKGSDPFLLGINYFRLGFTKDQMTNNYSKSAYSVEWFEKLNSGYDCGNLENNYPKSNIPNIDTNYVFNNIKAKVKIGKFTDTVISEGMDNRNRRTETSTILVVDQMQLTVSFIENLFIDGTYYNWYSINVKIKGDGFKYDTDHVTFPINCPSKKVIFNFDIRSFVHRSKKDFEIGAIQNCSKHKINPDSSVIAELLHKIVVYYKPNDPK